jgi:hypothetical protein
MEQKNEKLLCKFKLDDIDFHISNLDQEIFIFSPNKPHLPRMPLDLPIPEHNNNSTTSSTYDNREKTSLDFSVSKHNANEAIIDITIVKTSDYWYYGSLSDDWHPQDSEITKKRLIVRRALDKAEYRLTDVS